MSVSRSQRAPSAEQLYAFGHHAAAGTVEIGGPNLGKETYTNFEIGLDRHIGAFRYDFTLFYNDVNDFISLASQNDAAGQEIKIDGNILVLNEQQNARFYGLEFGAVADIIDGPIAVSLRFSADHVRGKLNSGGNLPRMSPTRVGLGVDSAYKNFDFSLDYRRILNQHKIAITESNTDGYNLVSFDVNWSPASWNGTELFIQGRNLLNEYGRRHTSFFKDQSPILGRTLYTGIRFAIGG
jgi:iron complex outermembrane receptor protein